MAELKERFQVLAERLFSRFSSVAKSAVFINPGELDPISGAEVTPADELGPVEVQVPRISGQARAALGLETREFFVVALKRDVTPFEIMAERTSLKMDGVEYEVVSTSEDPAGATWRVRCSGGA